MASVFGNRHVYRITLRWQPFNRAVSQATLELTEPRKVCGPGRKVAVLMKKWTRWQDWVALVAGAYAILSPLWTTTVAAATGTLILLGIIIALAAVASLAEPDAVMLQPLVAAIGAVVFVSPWVMGFGSTIAMAWTAWIVGLVTFVAGLLALPASNQAHNSLLAAQH